MSTSEYGHGSTAEKEIHSDRVSPSCEEMEQYNRFSTTRKAFITAVVSAGAFLPPLSSTMISSALPQVTKEYRSTEATVNLSNALYLVAAGISPCFIGPLSSLYGRKPVLLVVAFCYAAFSLGTGLAPNIGSYFAFRMLTAFAATGFLTTGNTCIGDIYHPTQRGRAGGWFCAYSSAEHWSIADRRSNPVLAFELGPTCGPFLGGVMVTYLSWRTQFYLQSALGAFVFGLFLFFLPETAPTLGYRSFAEASLTPRLRKTLQALSPLRVIALFRHRTILAAGLGSGALMWNMYSIITPLTSVLNPRFQLTTPLQSGLFFLAPGAGYILGSLLGGHWTDWVVRFYMKRRNGTRLPEDRLKSCLPFLGVVGPVSVLLYGWSIQKEFGGVALPVIMMFLQAFAQVFGFLTINPYCLDVMQSHGRSADVVASNYAARYAWGAAGIAAALPIIESIGVGWLSVISAMLLLLATSALWVAAECGPAWRGDNISDKSTVDAT